MKAARPGLRRGFTLLEVLVSLAIFAFAAVVLSVAYLNVIGAYRALGAHNRADEDWKLLRMVVLSEADSKKVEEGGRVSLADGRQLTWKAKIEPTDVADLFQLVLEADVPASGTSEAWQRRQVLHLLRPAWSEPAERDRLRDITRQRILRERGK